MSGVLALAALCIMAPIMVALAGGSMFWVVATGVTVIVALLGLAAWAGAS